MRVTISPPATVMQPAQVTRDRFVLAKRTSLHLLGVITLSSVVACQAKPAVKTTEVTVTAAGCTKAFVAEHDALFGEVIRLKQALKDARVTP